MAVRAKTLTVSTTSQAVLDASKSLDGIGGTVVNTGVTIVYVGGDDLTNANYATNGIAIQVGGSMDDIDLPYGDIMYVVVPSGSGTVAVIATRV